MKQIKAKVKAVGKKTYTVNVEGIGRDGLEAARYNGENSDPELTARQCAGAYVKGYNQAVTDVAAAIEMQLDEMVG